MGEIEAMEEVYEKQKQANRVKISDIFFTDTGTKPEKKIEKRETPKDFSNRSNISSGNQGEFTEKGTNIKLEETYDIHFQIGSSIFENLITFINDIGYDSYIVFKKKEITIITIDPSNTHASVVRIEKSELLEYEDGLENDNNEKTIFIDTSSITGELSINENYPIDFYVDTKDMRRFYVVCGKEYIWQQLTFITENVTTKYVHFKDTLKNLTDNRNYQRVIINQYPLMNLLKSISKKAGKKKDEEPCIELQMNKKELRFIIQNENRGSNNILLGEDVLVYPINEDESLFAAEYFIKFGNLKLPYTTNLYIYGTNLPIIMESRLGGGRMTVSYLMAPKIRSE